MKSARRKWIVPFAVALAFVLIACTCSGLSGLSGLSGASEALPGLAGSWVDSSTRTVCVIAWNRNTYTVTSCIDDDGEVYPLTDQSWSDGALTWSLHVPSTGYDLTYQTVSLQGDSLMTRWWGTAGSGDQDMQRVR